MSKFALGISLPRLQQILVVQGLLEGVGMSLELYPGRFRAFSADLDVGSVSLMSLKNMKLIPHYPRVS